MARQPSAPNAASDRGAATTTPRKPTTRSRTGCSACRKRRTKCDEARPACGHCVETGKACTYLPRVPLRERRAVESGRALPGQQKPWHVVSTSSGPLLSPAVLTPLPRSPGKSVDPFDSLALPMTLKSSGLFHYYFSANDVFFSFPPFSSQNLMTSANQDEDVLRNILFIASWHYVWNVGSLQDYTTTYYAHKTTSLQKVREWLKEGNGRQSALRATRSIATHCIVDVSMGNVVEAQTHLRGLMTLVDMLSLGSRTPVDLQEELINRYVLLTLLFTQSLQARVRDAQQHSSPLSTAKSDTYAAIKRGHREEPGGLSNRLTALLLIPFFLLAPGGVEPSPIDARVILDTFVDVTSDAEARLCAPATPASEFWNKGSTIVSFHRMLESHLLSVAGNWKVQPEGQFGKPMLESAWSPLVAASALYFGIILAVWDSEVFSDYSRMCYLYRIVRQDVMQTKAALSGWSEERRQLWFWKTFVVALCQVIQPDEERTRESIELESEMSECIRQWGALSGYTAWLDAREALVSMVWPRYHHLEWEAAKLWLSSVSRGTYEILLR